MESNKKTSLRNAHEGRGGVGGEERRGDDDSEDDDEVDGSEEVHSA